jgi:hypothetical protein
MYQVIYQEGKKQSEGKVIAGGKTVEEIKNEYQSYAKKAMKGKQYLVKNGIFERHNVENFDKIDKNEANFDKNEDSY